MAPAVSATGSLLYQRLIPRVTIPCVNPLSLPDTLPKSRRFSENPPTMTATTSRQPSSFRFTGSGSDKMIMGNTSNKARLVNRDMKAKTSTRASPNQRNQPPGRCTKRMAAANNGINAGSAST